MRPCTFLSAVLTAVEMVSHKRMKKPPKMSLLSVTMPAYVIARGCGGVASKERVIVVLELLGPALPVHFHRVHKNSIQGVETIVMREPPLAH